MSLREILYMLSSVLNILRNLLRLKRLLCIISCLFSLCGVCLAQGTGSEQAIFWDHMPDVSGGVIIVSGIGTIILIMGALVMIIKRARSIIQ